MDSLRNALLAGLGAFGYTQEKLKGAINGLIDKGDLTREQGERVLSEWVKRGEEEQSRLGERVTEEIQRVLGKLSLVSRDELEALERRVEELERRAAGSA